MYLNNLTNTAATKVKVNLGFKKYIYILKYIFNAVIVTTTHAWVVRSATAPNVAPLLYIALIAAVSMLMYITNYIH